MYTYPLPTSNDVHYTYSYHGLSSDDDILLEISSSFIQLKDLCIAQINAITIATTKNVIRSAIIPLIRHYRSDKIYNLKRLQDYFAINKFCADLKSSHASTCCQIYWHKVGFEECYDFVHELGAPEHITFNVFQS